jgi:DNA-binding response OmpR family regulator
MSKRILLVSDRGGPEHELKRALRRAADEFEIECAATRSEIVALPLPCLIILDLMLSSEPAPRVLGWLRSEPVYHKVPVFVLGSENVKREITESLRLGANSCLLMDFAREQIDPIAEGIATYASLLPTPAFGACW